MSRKSKSRRVQNHRHAAEVIVRGSPKNEDPVILLACRRVEQEDDCIRMTAYTTSAQAEVSMTIEEAEAIFEQAQLLVNDEKQRPIGGNVFLDTSIGDSGGRVQFSLDDPESYTAVVEIRDKLSVVSQAIDRGVLDRFLFSAIEGICQDLEDDD